jgi:hypothetical protein
LVRFRRQGNNVALRRAGFPGERRFGDLGILRITGILPFVTIYIVKFPGVVLIFDFLFGYGISPGLRNPYRGERYRLPGCPFRSGRVAAARPGGSFAVIPAFDSAGSSL